MALRIAACTLFLAFAVHASADDKGGEKEDEKKAVPVPTHVKLPAPTVDSPAGKAFAELYVSANAELATTKADGVDKVLAAMAEKVVAIARKYPTDDATLEALVLTMGLSTTYPGLESAKTRSEAAELIRANFTRSPAIRKHLRSLAMASVAGDDLGYGLVRGVYKDHPEPATRARAAKELVSGLEMRVLVAEVAANNKPAREQIDKKMGKDATQKLIDGVPQAKKDAEEYRAALRTEFKNLLLSREVGDKAPETVCQDLDGKTVKLSELKGKVVVLDFWATWCGPCRAMIPHTRDLVKSMDGKPFAFVGVSVDDEKATLTQFLEKTPMPWTHWWDGKMAVAELWDVEAFPTLYVVDHAGVIRFKTKGYDPNSGKLDAAVEGLVKAAGAAK